MSSPERASPRWRSSVRTADKELPALSFVNKTSAVGEYLLQIFVYLTTARYYWWDYRTTDSSCMYPTIIAIASWSLSSLSTSCTKWTCIMHEHRTRSCLMLGLHAQLSPGTKWLSDDVSAVHVDQIRSAYTTMEVMTWLGLPMLSLYVCRYLCVSVCTCTFRYFFLYRPYYIYFQLSSLIQYYFFVTRLYMIISS